MAKGQLKTIQSYLALESISNLLLFAPNASGKTIFAESKVDSSVQAIFSSKIETAISTLEKQNSFKHVGPKVLSIAEQRKTNNSDLLDLEIKEESSEIILSKEDIIFLNDNFKIFGIYVVNDAKKVNIFEVKFRKSKEVWKITEKLGLSSSEEKFIKTFTLACSYLSSGIDVILDDPIEFASYSIERLSLELINKLAKRFNKRKITVLTHRISVFQQGIGILDKVFNKKYFSDGFLFDLSSREFNEVFFNPMDVTKRILVEKAKTNLSIGAGINFVQELKKISDYFDVLSSNKEKRSIDLSVKKISISSLADYFMIKMELLHMLRTFFEIDLCELSGEAFNDKKTVNKLLNTIKSQGKDHLLWKKDVPTSWKDSIVYMLNQPLHSNSLWIFHHEFELSLICKIMNELNFAHFRKTKIALDKIESILPKITK